MRTLIAIALVSSLAVATLAADAPATPRYFEPAEVDAARAKGDTGSVLVEDTDYRVLASRRDRPGQSEVHATDTDIFVVIDGQATIVLGGRMIEPKATAPGEIRGSGIEGGTDYLLQKGVVLTVPRNTPHWVRETRAGFRYYVIKSIHRD